MLLVRVRVVWVVVISSIVDRGGEECRDRVQGSVSPGGDLCQFNARAKIGRIKRTGHVSMMIMWIERTPSDRQSLTLTLQYSSDAAVGGRFLIIPKKDSQLKFVLVICW